MTIAMYRATIERTPSPTPRSRPHRPIRRNPRLHRVAVSVSVNAVWIAPTLALAWPRADLVLVALILLVVAGGAALAAVVTERSTARSGGEDGRTEQQLSALLFLTFVVGATDVGRLGWSPDALRDARLAGIFVLGLGYILRTIVVGTNGFFATVVLARLERHHVICDIGPYEYVRHPGDVASMVIVLSIPVAMGSVIAMAPALVGVAVLLRRARLEDELLHRSLPGYRAYAARVRWRLVPGVF